MKKVTNKILIITACIIIVFVIVSIFVITQKINDKTIDSWLPEQTQNDETSQNSSIQFNNGIVDVKEDNMIVEVTSDSNSK